MGNAWNYSINHYDRDDLFLTVTDISDRLMSIPIYTDTGSGTFNSAVVTLANFDGMFINKAPIIEKYDRIRIESNSYTGLPYDKVFDVMKVNPIKDESGATRVELILLGIEHWLDKFNFSQRGYFKTPKQMGNLLVNQYLKSIGTGNPLLQTTTFIGANDSLLLPNYPTNIYQYGVGPEKIYSRIGDLTDKLGGSVENGGVLDFFDYNVLYSSTSVNIMALNVFSSGKKDTKLGNEVTVNDLLQIPLSNIRGGLDGFEANVINAFGGDTDGSLPRQYAVFRSAQERYDFAPEWQNDTEYFDGALVQYLGNRYRAQNGSSTGDGRNSHDSGVSGPPPNANWNQVSRGDEYGNTIQYSPWTVDKAKAIWQNSGGDPSGAFGPFATATVFDSNLVYWDEDAFRTWVDVKIDNPANMPVFFKFYDDTDGDYRGLRALVDGVGSGDFAGNDVNGRPFANNIAEYDPELGWFVKYETEDGMNVAVFHESANYTKQGGSWVDTTFDPPLFIGLGGDCWHPPDNGIVNAPGIITDFTGLNEDSAISATYTFNPGNANLPTPIGFRNQAPYLKQGAWLALRFPFPVTTFNSISENVGDIFGGGTNSTGVGNQGDVREPVLLDIQNNEWTPTGKQGWNQDTETENLGQISSIDFFIKMTDETEIPLVGFQLSALQANYKMRCTVTDRNDNTAIQDFNIEFNDKWQAQELPIGGFSTIRNRRPKDLLDLVIPPKELNTQNQFEWRHVKSISFQTQESYDEEGRYDPQSGRYGLVDIGGILGLQRRLTLSLDGFRFTKPLIANTGQPGPNEIVIESQPIERPDIGNYFQLLGDALSEKEKKLHPYVEYTIQTGLQHDIEFGDYFILEDTETVPFADRNESSFGASNGDPNTVRLVAKHIEYSLSEDGLIRTIIGIKRFV